MERPLTTTAMQEKSFYQSKKLIVIGVACMILIPFIAWVYESFANRDALLFYALDIGQGDSLLLQTPHDKLILIDGGPNQNVLQALGDVLPFFMRTFDYVILTHPDRDHLDGLLPVLERYGVKNFMLTGIWKDNAFYRALIEKILENKIPVQFAEAGSDIVIDGVTLDILYPTKKLIGDRPADPNDTSIIIKATYDGRLIMLTGDAGVEIEKRIMESGADLHSDILKAGHHGSRTSTSDEFVSAVKPTYAVISDGRDNSFGHPHKEVVATLMRHGVNILRTDQLGTIICTLDKDSVICEKE